MLINLFDLCEKIHFLCIGVQPKLLEKLGKVLGLRLTEEETVIPFFSELCSRVKRSLIDLAEKTTLKSCNTL
jgi:hypothetical protein